MQRVMQIVQALSYEILGEAFLGFSLWWGYFEVSIVIHRSWDLSGKLL